MTQKKSRIRIATATLILAGLVALSGAAYAAGPGVQVEAKGPVGDVLKSLKKMVADNGMMVMGELHQGKVLEMTGLKVKSETVFVGNPTVGKDAFAADPGAGIVLPVRGVLITDRFMLGPSAWSDLLGYGYHFWNGASFGLIFSGFFSSVLAGPDGVVFFGARTVSPTPWFGPGPLDC